MTARLQLDADLVRWSDFAWENTYEDPSALPDVPRAITFRRADYDDQLAGAYQRVAAMPFDELAEHGKKFRWPWQWGWRLPRRES